MGAPSWTRLRTVCHVGWALAGDATDVHEHFRDECSRCVEKCRIRHGVRAWPFRQVRGHPEGLRITYHVVAAALDDLHRPLRALAALGHLALVGAEPLPLLP